MLPPSYGEALAAFSRKRLRWDRVSFFPNERLVFDSPQIVCVPEANRISHASFPMVRRPVLRPGDGWRLAQGAEAAAAERARVSAEPPTPLTLAAPLAANREIYLIRSECEK